METLPVETLPVETLPMTVYPYCPTLFDALQRFLVSSGVKLRSLETADVAYFFFAEKATWLTPWQGPRVDVEYRLDKLAELLDPARFFRVNRSFLVAREAIHTIHAFSGGKLKLDLPPPPREKVFVRGDRVPPFKEWLGK